MKIKGTIAISSNRYKTNRKEVLTMTDEKTKKRRKVIYWIASIALAVATCVLGLLETSCCPHLIKNISDGYEKMYETIFYTVKDGDTTYYATTATLEKLQEDEANICKNNIRR